MLDAKGRIVKTTHAMLLAMPNSTIGCGEATAKELGKSRKSINEGFFFFGDGFSGVASPDRVALCWARKSSSSLVFFSRVFRGVACRVIVAHALLWCQSSYMGFHESSRVFKLHHEQL